MATLDPTTMAIARDQHGMLTTRQLKLAGFHPLDLVSLVKRRILQHPARGLYAVDELVDPDPRARHRQLVAGAFLLYPDAILTGTSALLSQGIDVWGAALDRPEILRPCHRGGGVQLVHVRRASTRPDPTPGPWGPCVPVADALVQHAMDAGIVPGVISADSALRMNRATEGEIESALERVKSWPTSSRARAMVGFMDGRRENVAESRCAVTLMFGGFELVPQVTIEDQQGRFVARVDFVIKGTRVIVEFDGKIKYVDDDGTALFEEKKREDRLRRLGYVVVRIIWADLEQPGRLIAKVRQALKLAA